jgi:hypothetical protein
VLGYFISHENLRPVLLPASGGESVRSEESLGGIAVSGSRWVEETLMKSERVMSSPHAFAGVAVEPLTCVQRSLPKLEKAGFVGSDFGALKPMRPSRTQ